MTKNDRLTILSATEQFAFYGLPDFDDKQRRKYFNFLENEMKIIMRNSNPHLNIYCALQVGYFKAKKIFFNILWGDIIPEDLQFIINNYFSNVTITGTKITKYKYYYQRQDISNVFGYKPWSKEFLPLLYEEATHIIKRDISPNFIALQLLSFLDDNKIIRPGYTTLQAIVSTSLTNERNRISNILEYELTQDYKLKLDNLIISDSSLSKLASFKQDAKNFGFKMMFKEREKRGCQKDCVSCKNSKG